MTGNAEAIDIWYEFGDDDHDDNNVVGDPDNGEADDRDEEGGGGGGGDDDDDDDICSLTYVVLDFIMDNVIKYPIHYCGLLRILRDMWPVRCGHMHLYLKSSPCCRCIYIVDKSVSL